MASTTGGRPVLVFPHLLTPTKPPRKSLGKSAIISDWNNKKRSNQNGYGNLHDRLMEPVPQRKFRCCTKTYRPMGFGTELQGKASHDSLLKLQDTEIRLLETIKKCVTQRIKCDRDYALALTSMVTTAQKVDNAEFNTPLFQAWEGIIHETESLIKLIRDNADKLCARSLERLVQLINEKKAARRTYAEERHRLDTDFSKLQDDVNKNKTEYEKLMNKLSQEKAKYEDLLMKGKAGSKFEDAKNKYHRTTMKLHRVHNDYVMALKEVGVHQRHHLRTTLPCLLDFQQEVQESLVQQCKEILQEYAEMTDTSSDTCSKCHREIYKNVRGIRPMAEYDTFIEKCKTDPIPSVKFDFQAELLEEYKGGLQPSEIAVDDLCYDQLLHSKSMYEEQLASCQQKKKAKKEELQQLEAELAGMPTPDKIEESAKNNYLVKKRAEQILKRELTELECLEEKYQALFTMVEEPLNALGSNDPPPGLELLDLSPADSPAKGESSSGSASSPLSSAALTKRFVDLQTRLKNPFKKQPVTSPPRPPNKDCLEVPKDGANNSPRGDEKKGARMPSDGYQQYDFNEEGSSKMTLQPNRRLDEEEWFHGVLPREEVVRLLKNDGDYLVRESKNRKTGETQYVLSVMWSQHKHFIIQGTENSWRFEGEAFPTVQELILNQHKSSQPVTKKSEAILKKAILKEQWELRNDDIELGERIGNGNFGEVFRGRYKPSGEEVAIKTCRETLSDDAKKKFLQEGRILKQYDHANIVRFVGIAAQRQPVMIVMEYVPGGALLTFLRKQGQKQTKKHLIRMCEDASAGMAYLESKNCIHRDLAARNCLVSRTNGVKISDFGMSREEEMYTVSGGLKQIPIKWTAPEALNYGTYTSACDVWSFGILMWEVFSYGATPYPGFTNSQARERIDDGYRMPSPDGMPTHAYDLMLRCWEHEPKDRPRFEEIYRDLQRIRNTVNS